MVGGCWVGVRGQETLLFYPAPIVILETIGGVLTKSKTRVKEGNEKTLQVWAENTGHHPKSAPTKHNPGTQ